MKIFSCHLQDVKLIEPDLFEDNRGVFFESFNAKNFADCIAKNVHFLQDNQSESKKNVLRGLHYQIKNVQAKLVRVVAGCIYDVAIDLRKSSPTFGQWECFYLSAENKKMVWIPEGFAHGFLVLSSVATVLYKTTSYYDPSSEKCLIWNDPHLAILWPVKENILVSAKDSKGLPFSACELFP